MELSPTDFKSVVSAYSTTWARFSSGAYVVASGIRLDYVPLEN